MTFLWNIIIALPWETVVLQWTGKGVSTLGIPGSTRASQLEPPEAPSGRQVSNIRVREKMVLTDMAVNFSLEIFQGRVCGKSQVSVNVKRTTGRFHSGKISAVIIFKWVQKKISPQTALSKEGFRHWGIIELTLGSVFGLVPHWFCLGLVPPSAKHSCLFHSRAGVGVWIKPP